jgi:hypothetical protein
MLLRSHTPKWTKHINPQKGDFYSGKIHSTFVCRETNVLILLLQQEDIIQTSLNVKSIVVQNMLGFVVLEVCYIVRLCVHGRVLYTIILRQWCSTRDITDVYLDFVHRHWAYKHDVSKANCFRLQLNYRLKKMWQSKRIKNLQIHM